MNYHSTLFTIPSRSRKPSFYLCYKKRYVKNSITTTLISILLIILTLSLVKVGVFGFLLSPKQPVISEPVQPLTFPIPKKYRVYHRCTVEKVPHISGFLETAQYLLWTNTSLARFGDWEVMLMIQYTDHHQNPYNLNLSQSLYEVFTNSLPNLSLGIIETFSGYDTIKPVVIDYYSEHDEWRRWMLQHLSLEKQYFQACISSSFIQTQGTHCLNLPQIYTTLRQIWEGKDIVLLRGNNSQVYKYDIYNNSRTQTVLYAPRKNAHLEHNQLKQLLLDQDPHKLYILSCGPIGTVLAYDLAKHGRRALDLGHLAKDYDWYHGAGWKGNFWQD